MKRKILLLCLLLSTAVWTFAYDFKSGDLYYNITSDSTVEITYQNRSSNNYSGLTSAVIPESVTYAGTTYSVTSIGILAFRGCSSLTSIAIPNSVTSIGNYAFKGCSSLTSIAIPNSVTSIRESAFENCSSLTSITIPNGVTSVGESAFKDCSGLTSVVWNAKNCANFTSSSTPFYYYSYGDSNNFDLRSQITSFVFGDSVQHIPAYICKGMKNLTSLTIPNSVTSIGNSAFNGCCGLKSVVWNAKNCANFTSSSTPFYYYSYGDSNNFDLRSQITSFVFGDSVQRIPAYLCCGMKNLTSITIPNSVTSIGNYAFSDCSGLTSITIPNSVTSIEYRAFFGCSGLKSVTIGNSVTSIGNYAFSDCSGLTSITIPNSVTSIGNYAFSDCSGLTSITIPNSVTSIGEGAFWGCSGLKSVTIPNSVTSIGSKAFSGCSGLTSITIPNSVTSIGSKAFSGCSGLTSVTIPNSVASIGEGAFRDCSGLTSVTIPNSVTSIGGAAFSQCSGLTSVAWNAKNCKDFTNGTPFDLRSQITSFVFGDSVQHIPAYLCDGMKKLTSIIFPNSVTSIGSEAFSGCSGLTSVTIPNSVTSIGESAFKNVPNIVYFGTATGAPWDAKNMNAYVDSDTTQTTLLICGRAAIGAITIPNSVTSIGDYAFSGCSSLTSITIPNSVTNIGDYAFSGCSSLTSVVWNAKNYANFTSSSTPFYYYSNGDSNNFDLRSQITSFVFGDSVQHIPEYICKGMKNLTSVTIGNSVTSIGYHAFYDCDGLTSVVWNAKNYVDFTSNNTPFYYKYSVGYHRFEKFDIRSQITSFVFGDSVQHIPAYICNGMNNLTSLTIPNSVTSIGNSAFAGCYRLTKTNYMGDVSGWYRIKFDDRSANPIENSRNLFLNNVLVTDLIVPADLDTINDAFSRDTCLFSVVIPNSVTTIGESAFAGCSGLGSLIIPNSITSMGSRAFEDCISLTTIIIPGSIKSIESSLFSGCTGLRSVIISEGVTSVGDEAFRNCAELTYVTCYAAEPPSVSSNAFYGVEVDTIPLYVPMESRVKYKSSDVWKDFLVLPISAMPVDVDEPILNPEENKVTITWPAVEDAIAYTIKISNDSALVCTLVFDASGALKNMHYAAPARHAAQHTTQAETTGYGFRFVVEGLDYATTYTYTITATDIDDAVLVTYTGTFTTTGYNPTTDTEDIRSAQSQPATRKVFRNGQVLILRGDKTYTLTGEEL